MPASRTSPAPPPASASLCGAKEMWAAWVPAEFVPKKGESTALKCQEGLGRGGVEGNEASFHRKQGIQEDRDPLGQPPGAAAAFGIAVSGGQKPQHCGNIAIFNLKSFPPSVSLGFVKDF